MVIESGPTTTDKIMYWVLGIIMVAFIISIPFMVRDKNARLEHAWQTQGCEMYDDVKAIDVPAKCSQYFVDHYKAQPIRTQPPDKE